MPALPPLTSERRDPGERALRWVDVTTLATGLPLRVAVHDIQGARPGPTVGVTAGIHGDELAPIEAVRRLLETLDPAQMSGRLLVAPVVNPLAFQAQTRHTPQDMQNLNRVFAGDPGGWLSEQLAHAFTSAFLPGLDALLDLHAGGALPTVDYAYINNDEGLSRSLGTKALYLGPSYYGTFTDTAMERGVRCVVSELGGGLVADARYIRQTVEGIANALRYLGVLPGEATQRDDQIVMDNLAVIRPRFGGLMVPAVGTDMLGEVVPGGTLLGTVYNAQTFEALEAIHAPYERTLMILTRGAVTRVEAGDYAFMVSNLGLATQ